MPVSTKQTPTIKSIVIATCQEYIVALKMFYNNVVENMFAQVRKQDVAITNQQTFIVENQRKIIALQQELLEAKKTIINLQNQIPHIDEVKQLERRMRELSYIAQSVYTLVYNKIPGATLPDFNNPELPEDKTPTTPTTPSPDVTPNPDPESPTPPEETPPEGENEDTSVTP